MPIYLGTARNRFVSPTDSNSPFGKMLRDAKSTVGNMIYDLDVKIYQPSYVEDGSIEVPGYNFYNGSYSNVREPNKRAFYTQRPKTTVFIHKKMFAALRGNFDLRYMDNDEKLYLRAVKSLFKRKCDEIAFYESLVNINSIYETGGFLNAEHVFDAGLDSFANILNVGFGISSVSDFLGLDPLLFANVDLQSLSVGGTAINATGSTIEEAFATLGETVQPIWNFMGDLYRLKKANERSRASSTTAWVDDPETEDLYGLGPGSGVIELNLVSNVSAGSSLNAGGGRASLDIQDPYRLTMINDGDIEVAVRKAIGQERGVSGYFEVSGDYQLELAQTYDAELADLRNARGAPAVEFQFDAEGKVVGIFAGTSIVFTDTTIYNHAREFTAPELIRAVEIMKLLFSYVSLQQRAMSAHRSQNTRYNALRARLRAEFLGHGIVQPMDTVTIYINSNTKNDSPVSASTVQSAALLTIERSLEDYKNRISDDLIRQEHQQLAPSLPFELYKAMRNKHVFRDDGMCVFSGLTETVDFSYSASNGEFRAGIVCTDNTKFLTLTRINQPGLANTAGVLYDPLTPFDIDQDDASGLIKDPGSIQLTQKNKDRLKYLFFNDGDKAGNSVANEQDLIVDAKTQENRRVITLQHVPGLVYKWKKGIISASLNINGSPLLNGQGETLAGASGDFGISVISGVLAKLDAADVVSIMVTGQPHNYSTFVRNALQAGSLSLDNSSNTRNFLNFTLSFFKRLNPYYGNFIAAKDKVLSPEEVAAAFDAQSVVSRLTSRISILRKKLAENQQNIRKNGDTGNQPAIDANIQQTSSINNEIADLQSDLDKIRLQLPQRTRIALEGNSAFLSVNNDEIKDLSNSMRYAFIRKPEDVRFNRDKNYFIISNKYDTDTAIQAFALEQINSDFNLWKTSEFMYPFKISQEVASTIGFEFFADSQGNIRFRPPEYNKTPLSLLNRLIEMSQGDGVNLMPSFIASLLTSRIDITEREMFRTELQIYEKLLLGTLDGSKISGSQFDIVPALQEVGSAAITQTNSSGSIGQSLNKSGSLNRMSDKFSSGPNSLDGSGQTLKLDLKKVQAELRRQEGLESTDAFTERARQIVGDVLTPSNNLGAEVFGPRGQTALLMTATPSTLPSAGSYVVNQLVKVRKELEILAGKTGDVDRIAAEVEEDIRRIYQSDTASINKLKLVNEMAGLVSRRQSLFRGYRSMMNGYKDAKDINSSASTFFQTGLTGGNINSNDLLNNLPEFLKDMVENDLQNDEGPRSGLRYIIGDDVILNMNFSNKAPEFTTIETTGAIDFLSINGTLAGLPVIWAGATDFDSWRQYGYRDIGQAIHRPDFKNAETQCAPYSVFKLLQQRKSIHTGSITVIGNEYYQAGDVVYITSKSMLYYVVDVQHSIDLNSGSYTTSLELAYGRTLGEYIPTPLDVLGKGLLAEYARMTNIKTHRNAVPAAANVLTLTTAILQNYASAAESSTLPKLLRQFVEQNKNKLSAAALRAAAKQAVVSEDRSIAIEIRAYYVSSSSGLIMNGSFFDSRRIANDAATEVLKSLSSFGLNQLNAVDNIKLIDLSQPLSEDDRLRLRMPSEEAWSTPVSLRDPFNSVSTELPINAVDVCLVTYKNNKKQARSQFDNSVDALRGAESPSDTTVSLPFQSPADRRARR